jgi:translation initiation factor 2-alpha kinase 4
MERFQVLRALRSEQHTLPAEFQKQEKALQGDIIKLLISHRPSERPSTTELLRSGKIPLQIQDETIRQALQGIWDPNSPHYQKMLSALFSQTTKPAKDWAWDMQTSTVFGPNELVLQQMIKDKLVALFRRHGAVETARPLLFPRSNDYSANVVQLLDASGTLLQLPYDLILPHARVLAKMPALDRKTYTFGDVYRDLHTGSQPKSHGEVDFDIISKDSLDLALKEGEVITVLNEIIDTFPSLHSVEMCFHFSHGDLLDMILDFCRIELPQRPAVKDALSKLNIGQWTWLKIRNELRSPSLGIKATSLDDLSRFDFRGMSLRLVVLEVLLIATEQNLLRRRSRVFSLSLKARNIRRGVPPSLPIYQQLSNTSSASVFNVKFSFVP